MKRRLVDYVVCPYCTHFLRLEIKIEEGDEILEGVFVCDVCAEEFPIIRGIPRFVRHSLPDLQVASQKSFSKEWEIYARLGFTQLELEQDKFLDYTRTVPSYFKNRLVLDAGCGNGRYANIVAGWGGEVIAFDISDAVEVAYQNIGHLPGVHILQADIFHMPFKKSLFDCIYSIGVLHHTPDARRAFQCLVPFLKPGGILSIFVYGKVNPLFYWINKTLRKYTAKLPHRVIWYLCYVPTYFVKFLNLFKFVGPMIHYSILHVVWISDQHSNFDAYSAGFTSFHDREEVEHWYRENSFMDIIVRTVEFGEAIYGTGRRE